MRINRVVIVVFSTAWFAPLVFFWLYVWGPLRPFAYPPGPVGPSLLVFAAAVALSLGSVRLPRGYFHVWPFERTGSVYRALGVRPFRYLVTDGGLENRWRRRRQPGYRIIRSRAEAAAYVARSEFGEMSHLWQLVFGAISAAYAWHIGWRGWGAYLVAANVVLNLYPVLLQRYTRSRIVQVLRGGPADAARVRQLS